MNNPLLEDWNGPFGTPPLDRIAPAHFPPAFEHAMARHKAEIVAIAENPAPPSFDNSIAALEKSGEAVADVEAVFATLTATAADDALRAIELEMAPRLAAHHSAIYLNARLFARIEAVHAGLGELDGELDNESARLVARLHMDFVRAGAKLAGPARARLDAITQRLAILGTQFTQNVMGDESEFLLPLDEAQSAGLPDFARQAAAETARERGIAAPYAVTLSRSEVEPVLQCAHDRAVRERSFKAWIARGDNPGARNNRAIIAETLALRRENAMLLGYPSHAAFKLADSMAGSEPAARALLQQVWAPAKARALEERDALQELIVQEGGNFALAPWDWRYYAEKLRAQRYAFDEAALKPYFTLDNMIEAAFFTAQRLFGVTFRRRTDIAVHHRDVKVWEVQRDGAVIGIFYGDYFARPGKQGGAWMSSLRDQQTLGGRVLPLVTNNCNFVKSEPALLSFDDARTLFHEFGHALHGLLSDVKYPRLSGTNVARDFVELPSQLFEHWLEEPEVLTRFARHHRTGAPLPAALLQGLLAARHFNQGFATVEFLASAFMDMDFHTAGAGQTDPISLASATLAGLGMPGEIAPRHGAPHFGHIFADDGYSAGYYSYLWSEVLDADGFGAFKADPFDPVAAQKLYKHIYASGGTRDFASAYREFRGRDPDVKALLEGRGLENT